METITDHMKADFAFMKGCAGLAGVPFANEWELVYANDHVFPYRIIDGRGNVARTFSGRDKASVHAEILGIGHAFRAAYEIAQGKDPIDFIALEHRHKLVPME